jgi:hypothetical protein
MSGHASNWLTGVLVAMVVIAAVAGVAYLVWIDARRAGGHG